MATFNTNPTRINIVPAPVERIALLPSAKEPITYGVNAGVAEYCKETPVEERPSTLDHVIAATAG
jgi:hypothetical protein